MLPRLRSPRQRAASTMSATIYWAEEQATKPLCDQLQSAGPSFSSLLPTFSAASGDKRYGALGRAPFGRSSGRLRSRYGADCEGRPSLSQSVKRPRSCQSCRSSCCLAVALSLFPADCWYSIVTCAHAASLPGCATAIRSVTATWCTLQREWGKRVSLHSFPQVRLTFPARRSTRVAMLCEIGIGLE